MILELGVSCPVFAERAVDLTRFSLEELMQMDVYSASKFGQKTSEAPSAVTDITAEDIKTQGYRTLADILRSLPGIYVNYDRSYSSVGVRGFGRPGDYNDHLLFLVDGYRINDNIYDMVPVDTDGRPFICAWVVGQKTAAGVERDKQLGNPAYGRVRAATFGSLVDTANARLLKLRTVLADRYGGSSTDELLNRVFLRPTQDGLGL